MSINRYYLEEYHFQYARIHGELNDQILMEHVQTVNESAIDIPDLLEIADCRELVDMKHLTVQGTAMGGMNETVRPDSLLAILVPESKLIYGLARAYQTFSEDKRKDTRIFTDFEEAVQWLTADVAKQDAIRSFIDDHCSIEFKSAA